MWGQMDQARKPANGRRGGRRRQLSNGRQSGVSLQLDKEKMQMKDTDHVRQKGAPAVRPPSGTEENAEQKDAEKKERETGQTFEVRWLPRRWPRLQARAEVFRTLQSLLHLSALIKDDLPAAFLETSEAYICLSPAAMSNSSSSSHARWQGAARWKQGWNEAWMGRDDSSTTTLPISESIPDERVTNALHLMQDHLQQTMVISQRQSQKTQNEQAASKTQGNAAYEVMVTATQAREQREEARLACDQNRMLNLAKEGCPGHGPFHLHVASLASEGFVWDHHMLGWTRPF